MVSIQSIVRFGFYAILRNREDEVYRRLCVTTHGLGTIVPGTILVLRVS